jgi:hypothetical protein
MEFKFGILKMWEEYYFGSGKVNIYKSPILW